MSLCHSSRKFIILNYVYINTDPVKAEYVLAKVLYLPIMESYDKTFYSCEIYSSLVKKRHPSKRNPGINFGHFS